jgi:hypothetical protein
VPDLITGPSGGVPDASTMTVAQAWERYSFAANPIGWHYQPVCVCGDYICQHEETPPHRCGFSARPGECRCYRYRFARMGTGPHPDDRKRWEAEGLPDHRAAENGP